MMQAYYRDVTFIGTFFVKYSTKVSNAESVAMS